MPKYGNSAPGPQKLNFSRKYIFFEKVSRFRFQRAPIHPQKLTLSQVMQENVIIPKYGNSAPGSQKWNFKKIHFLKRSPDFASNEPSTTPDIKFMSSMQENVILAYYGQIWKFGPRLLKMEFFAKFSFF